MSPYSNPTSNLLTQESGLRSQADATNWAVSACAAAARGDWRRTKRLVALAGVLAQHPIYRHNRRQRIPTRMPDDLNFLSAEL